ncbi:protein translocase subunit SecF [bacterium]|nr:protein translocase subunit SecF [bacterium]
MQFFKTPSIDFTSKRKMAYVVSAALFALGLVFLIIHGGPNLGIDFKGGTEIVVDFEQSVKIGDLRTVMTDADMGNSAIRHFGSSDEYQIYVEQQKEGSAEEVAVQVRSALDKGFGDTSYTIRRIETIGPKIGEELRRAMIWAILVALFLILVYISIRFELIFAMGAIIALFHDVLITFGIFSIVNFEISIKEIAAFLTIVGYSLNDTIVVYDRIRENLKTMRNESLATIINRSINQVLTRTVVTSVTTFAVVLILFLFGGDVINGFAFAMCVGVIIGTYSSIFVASSIVLEWQMRHGGKRSLKMAKKKK